MSYTLTVKETPIGADILIIKDSEDAGNVKCISIADLPVRYAESIERVAPMGLSFGGNTSGYFLWGRSDSYTGVEANSQTRFPKSKVVAMSGYISAYTGASVMTLRKNGADTGITLTVSATGQFHVTGDIDFAAGDLASVSFSVPLSGALTLYGLHLTLKTEAV